MSFRPLPHPFWVEKGKKTEDSDICMKSYARMTERIIQQLKTKKKMTFKALENVGRRREEGYTGPTVDMNRKCLITYRTMNLQMKKMGIALEEEIEKILEDIQKDVVY